MDRGRMTLTTPIKVPDSMPAESVSPKQSQGFVAELFDAITPRTVFLVSGVLLIQLAFVLSYVGAFHHPTPHQVPVVVVAPAQIGPRRNRTQRAPRPSALRHRRSQRSSRVDPVTRRFGECRVHRGPVDKTDSLLVASGGGAAVVTAVEDVFAQVEAAGHRTMTVTDAVPDQPGDGRGLSGFYLVVGWLVGGYLVAALLGIAKGPDPLLPAAPSTA